MESVDPSEAKKGMTEENWEAQLKERLTHLDVSWRLEPLKTSSLKSPEKGVVRR